MDKKDIRVLLLPHLFYPSVASTAQIYTDLFLELSDAFKITVLCAPSEGGEYLESHNKELDNDIKSKIEIINVDSSKYTKKSKLARIKHIVSYYFATKKAIRQLDVKYDVVFACSQPPIIGGMLGVYAKRKKKAKLVYNIQDFNPEQAKAVMPKVFSPLFFIMKLLDVRTCKKADHVIVVGEDMKDVLLKRMKNPNYKEVTVINNWVDENVVVPLKNDPHVDAFKSKYQLTNKFVFMYSGNIGLYYDLNNLIKVICDLPPLKTNDGREVAFVFVGDGAMKETLVRYCNEHDCKSVVFIPYQDKDKIIYSLNAADVHFVVNAKGIKGVSVPSKCFGVMAVAKPILGVLEKDSHCELLIRESGCGRVVEPQDYLGFKNEIEWFVNNSNVVSEMGSKGRLYLEKNCARQISIDKYKDIIVNVCDN